MSDTLSLLTIRTATLADAVTIADFNTRMALETEGLALRPETILAGVTAALNDPAKAIYFVAEFAGLVVGQLMITHEWSDWRNGDIWWIQSVYVHPEHRGRKVFRALYEHAREAGKRAGAIGLRLYVEENNAVAQSVYKKLGMSASHYRVMEAFWI